MIFYLVSNMIKCFMYLAPLPFPMTVIRTLIDWGGECMFIYSCFARQISLQIDQFEFDLKTNSSGRT